MEEKEVRSFEIRIINKSKFSLKIKQSLMIQVR